MTARDIIAAADQIAGMRDALEAIVALHEPVEMTDSYFGRYFNWTACRHCCLDSNGNPTPICWEMHEHRDSCPTRALASRALTPEGDG